MSAVAEYLEAQPGTTFRKLYQHPSTTLAVFRRMLPHLAQCLVMGLLYLDEPLPEANLGLWVRSDNPASIRERENSLMTLERLHILGLTQDKPGVRTYKLSKNFRTSLRLALTGGGNHRSFGVPCQTLDKFHTSIKDLDNYARERWEAILYYMVTCTGPRQQVEEGKRPRPTVSLEGMGASLSPATKTLLETGEFIAKTSSRAPPTITQAGFEFLLQEVNDQVWSLMLVYLNNATMLQMDPVDVLCFLFTLGSLELGQDYTTTDLTATQQQMLEDLNDFGIIYRRSEDPSRFFPTRLATTLTSDAAGLLNTSADFSGKSSQDKGFIVVETNYRLYAYTSSPLQIAILNLFVDLHTRFPNLIAGKLSKKSIQWAVNYGITADQIISFLTTHAHPQMRKSNPILPPTVADQIRLWQLEGDRMQTTSGHLIRDFASKAEYEDAVKYAEAIGVVVWKDDGARKFFIDKSEQMFAYFKKKRQEEQARREGQGQANGKAA